MFNALIRWSLKDRAGFWAAVIERLGIVFETASPFETPGLMVQLLAWHSREERDPVLHPLIRIADTSKCRLIVLLEASVSRPVKEQMSVRIRIDGLSNPNILPGTVEFVSPVVDPSSGLREVKVLFDNNDGHVNPGMTGTLLLK